MHEVELTLGLLVAVAVLTTVARPPRVPYPVLLVVGGLLLARSRPSRTSSWRPISSSC